MKRVVEYINAVLLFAIFAIMIVEIVWRGLLSVPVSWTDELARSVYIIMVFLGSSIGLRDRSHITVDILIQIIPEGGKRVLRIVSSLLMLPFITVMVMGAAQNTGRYWTSVVSTVGWLKVGHLYLSVAISGILMIFYLFLNLYDDIKNSGKTREA